MKREKERVNRWGGAVGNRQIGLSNGKKKMAKEQESRNSGRDE